MKNVTVLFGKKGVGKTFLAKSLSEVYRFPVIIDGPAASSKIDKFYFDQVMDHTDLIFIDDIPKIDFEEMVFRLFGELLVERKYNTPFEMKSPRAIITIDCDKQFIAQFGGSINARCNFIHVMNKPKGIDGSRIETKKFLPESFIPKKVEL